MIFATKISLLFLLAFFHLANAAVLDAEDAEIEEDARLSCDCPPINEDIVCKQNQKREKFMSDDVCKCVKIRCIWEICPEIQPLECGKCQVKVEVDDCGCKQFECQDKAPDHCMVNAVHCDKCSILVQEEDGCGCRADKCVPRVDPPSKCPCKECETCKKVDAGPAGCGLKESICVPVDCPPVEEKVCDPECESPKFVTSKCGCASMHCEPRKNATKIPECGKCEGVQRRIVPKCGIVKFECVKKVCEGPPKGQEQCYETSDGEDDGCGCPIQKRKKCNLVPSGDCPKGQTAQSGTDLCGCLHQICVPCKQVYPQHKKCKKCEKVEKRPVASGQCVEAVCVETPECNCPESKPAKCGDCEEIGNVRVSKHCVVKACVPSKSKECVCKHLTTKKSCGKCEKMKAVKTGDCKGVKTCTSMNAQDCPEMGSPECPACEKVAVVTDDCGCKKFICKKAPCDPLAKEMIKCQANKHKKVATIGVDRCQCPIQTCVDKKKVCEDLLRTTLAPRPPTTPKPKPPTPKPVPFPWDQKNGKMIFRNERNSGISSYDALTNLALPNVKTGDGYSNTLRPLKAAWINKEFVRNWRQHMKKGSQVRFQFWKREGNAAKLVVDLVFRGEGCTPTNFFSKGRLLQTGRLGGVNRGNFNYWSAEGHKSIKRNFFINKNYGGCPGDFGLVVVADKVDVCHKTWAGGKGWESFPRFLYASDPNGCKWADTACVRDADVMTISVAH